MASPFQVSMCRRSNDNCVSISQSEDAQSALLFPRRETTMDQPEKALPDKLLVEKALEDGAPPETPLSTFQNYLQIALDAAFKDALRPHTLRPPPPPPPSPPPPPPPPLPPRHTTPTHHADTRRRHTTPSHSPSRPTVLLTQTPSHPPTSSKCVINEC
ncbi:WAS/WASL-interacting protein family member 3-like [Schistocerca cancellata]|uniref:WAS/WASL-interacting protein family member 3-like n=1 Tax=Schistocerca cancellata TaxID=274614 RepID=UPI0021199ABC|nr:WAS/WASL-interacting protein family member 3-like [Schistocerca cancellata]